MNSATRSVLLRHAVRTASRRSNTVGGLSLSRFPCASAAVLLQNGQTTAASRSAQQLVVLRSFSSAGDNLMSMLQREYDEEKSNGADEMPEELKTLKAEIEKDWTVVDGTITKMHRTANNLKIQISFHCQDTIPIGGGEDNFGDEEFDPETGEPLDESNQPPPDEASQGVRFTASATKAGSSLVLQCLADSGVFRIEGASVSSEDVEKIHSHGGSGDASAYQGPEFSELAEDLKDSFQKFAEEDIGITENVASFINMYTDYGEQVKYIGFLQDAQNILK